MDELLDDDDRYTLENSFTFNPDDLAGKAKDYGEEIAELTSFLDDLAVSIPTDTKVQILVDDIQQAFFSGHDTVLVFTQFTRHAQLAPGRAQGHRRLADRLLHGSRR